MNKHFRRSLWLLPVLSGIFVFAGSGLYNLNAMQKIAGDGNFNPMDAFVLAFRDAAIVSLMVVQISVVIGFAWWAFVLARTVFGKNARQLRASRKVQQATIDKDQTNAV